MILCWWAARMSAQMEICSDGTQQKRHQIGIGSDPNLLEAVTAFLPLPDGGF
jgi:hypothetical protein